MLITTRKGFQLDPHTGEEGRNDGLFYVLNPLPLVDLRSGSYSLKLESQYHQKTLEGCPGIQRRPALKEPCGELNEA